jgi:hypothetical protein
MPSIVECFLYYHTTHFSVTTKTVQTIASNKISLKFPLSLQRFYYVTLDSLTTYLSRNSKAGAYKFVK